MLKHWDKMTKVDLNKLFFLHVCKIHALNPQKMIMLKERGHI